MRLEDVTAEIRPRAPWESIDLGCALARRHIGTLWKSWLVTVVPLWVLLAILLRHHPVWFMVVTWWLKPVYDRVPLLVVSRALFGAVPGPAEVWRAWPRLMLRRLWFALVVRRFSPARSLNMPVSELEGLDGADYRQRVGLLARNGGEGATMATLVGLLLEMVAGLGVVMLVLLMVPGQVSEQWMLAIGEMINHSEFHELSAGLLWAVAIVWLLAITLMEPFYVAAGFALYINSRTLTEGWDIELGLKRLGARLQAAGKVGGKKGAATAGKPLARGAGILMLCWLGLALLTSGPVVGASPDDAGRRQIEEVLQDEDFTIHHRIQKVPVEDEDMKELAIPAFLGEWIFYTVLTVVIAGLAYLVYANRHVFQRGDDNAADLGRVSRTREVMGMEVTPESLPGDVIAAAREAWQEGDYQRALSYLYRGAIVWLIHRADLPITESDTEADCLRHVQGMHNSKLEPYFADLTSSWISVAYGAQKPDEQAMERLCQAWPFANHERSEP